MPNTPPQLVAGGDVYPFRFVMVSTAEDTTALQATANAKIIGVARPGTKFAPMSDLVTDNPAAEDGDTLPILGPGEVGLVELGDTVVRGGYLKADADGKAVPILTTGTTLQRYGAVALQSGSSGNKVLVFVMPGSERPALV